MFKFKKVSPTLLYIITIISLVLSGIAGMKWG
jgi:hypothetical protein